MIGLGTIANTGTIIVGGVIGLALKSKMKPELAENLQKSVGLATVFIGAAGAFAGMLSAENGKLVTGGSLLLLFSLVIGTLIGELLRLEDRIEHLGEWLKAKVKSKENGFTDAFVTASLVVCVGAMAVVGSLNDGLSGDASMLYVKSAIDGIFIMILASSLGIGTVFSALPIFVYQGLITVFASSLKNVMTDALINDLTFVGSVLIFAVGINIIFKKKFRAGNMVPALIVPVVYRVFEKYVLK